LGEVINLNRVRKARKQSEASQEASANRVKFGRGKAQKENDRALRKGFEKTLDGKKLDE